MEEKVPEERQFIKIEEVSLERMSGKEDVSLII